MILSKNTSMQDTVNKVALKNAKKEGKKESKKEIAAEMKKAGIPIKTIKKFTKLPLKTIKLL